jgi:hypothetical protein
MLGSCTYPQTLDRLSWNLAREKHSSLLRKSVNYGQKSCITLAPERVGEDLKAVFVCPEPCIIKLITPVIYGFCNKLAFLSLNTRLGWKGSPGTNTLAYYGNP